MGKIPQIQNFGFWKMCFAPGVGIQPWHDSQPVGHGEIKAWLEKEDAYTLHMPVRKHFPRNPYTVNKVMDVWESDLVDDKSLSKFNNTDRYLLTIIDVFSKFLHVISLK